MNLNLKRESDKKLVSADLPDLKPSRIIVIIIIIIILSKQVLQKLR